ncbi:hypothetical protein ACFQ2B_20065 [Streptomyces stramineus]
MAEASRPAGTPGFAANDFHAFPHQQLEQMVARADVHRVTVTALKLHEASTTIKKIGDDLIRHMKRVTWDGQGGEAFRKWGDDMGLATIRLSEYAGTAGTWLNYAATTLGGATRMPKHSAADQATVDAYLKNRPLLVGKVPSPFVTDVDHGINLGGPTQKQAYDAQQRLEKNHAAAAELMKALAESYQESGVQIAKAERPKFPVVPGEMMPRHDGWYSDVEHIQPVGAGGAQGNGGEGESVALPGASVSPGSGPGVASPRAEVPDLPGSPSRGAVQPSPDRHVGTGIDSGPQLPTAPAPVPTGPPSGGPVGDTAPPQRYPVPPLPYPGPSGTGPVIGGRLPGEARPSVPPRQGPSSTRPSLPLPRPHDPGIVGGQPLPPRANGPTAPVPRGTVIGTEQPGHAGNRNPAMGHGPGPVGGFGGASPAAPPAARGRTFASEPGGVVGGRPGSRPGASSGGTFTPGGTGLPRAGHPVAGGGAVGMGPVHGAAGATPQRRNGGQRPAYLVEDEETWSQSSRRVVPPVIE